MSQMEIFYGYVQDCDEAIVIEDTDEFLDFEEERGCVFFEVDDKVYEAYKLSELDYYGFDIVAEPTDKTLIVCCWYNGGASVREALEGAWRSHLRGS